MHWNEWKELKLDNGSNMSQACPSRLISFPREMIHHTVTLNGVPETEVICQGNEA